MREMSATEAARNFKAVLDRAEHGETTVVTRGGHRVATIAPTPRANGAALREVLRRWHAHPAADADFAARVAEAREVATAEGDADPWRD